MYQQEEDTLIREILTEIADIYPRYDGKERFNISMETDILNLMRKTRHERLPGLSVLEWLLISYPNLEILVEGVDF